MFNDDIKTKYLEAFNVATTQKRRESFFSRISNYEYAFGNDVALMSDNEIKTMLEDLDTCNYKTLRVYIGILADYKNWYRDNVDKSTPMLNLKVREISIKNTLQNHWINGERDLIQCIYSNFALDDGYFIPPISVLLWYGLDLKDILDLKNEDVEFKNMYATVYAQPEAIHIENPSAIEILKQYANTKYYTRILVSEVQYQMDDIGYFIKNGVTANTKFAGRRLTTEYITRRWKAIQGTFEYAFSKLEIKYILLFGTLFRCSEREAKGYRISPKYYDKSQQMLGDFDVIYKQFKELIEQMNGA